MLTLSFTLGYSQGGGVRVKLVYMLELFILSSLSLALYLSMREGHDPVLLNLTLLISFAFLIPRIMVEIGEIEIL